MTAETHVLQLREIDFSGDSNEDIIEFEWPNLSELGGTRNMPNTTVKAVNPEDNRHLRLGGTEQQYLYSFNLLNDGTDRSNGTLDSSGIEDTRFAVGQPVSTRIKNVDTGSDQFVVAGDVTGKVDSSDTVTVFGRLSSNPTNHGVSSTSYDSSVDETTVTVSTNLTDSTIDGGLFNSVDSVDTANDVVTVEGDASGRVSSSDTISFRGSTGNDGTYSVSSVSYNSGSDTTDITLSSSIGDSTTDGWIQNGVVTVEEQIIFLEIYMWNPNLSPQWRIFGGRFSNDGGSGTEVTVQRATADLQGGIIDADGIMKVSVGKVV